MAFTLDPAVPADSETPRNGASRIRSLTAEVLELFGETGSASETYTLAPIASVDKTTGLATVQGVPTTSLGIATKGYVDASTPSNVFVGSAAGTNTITTTLAPVPANQAALAGFVIHLRIANTNTGAVTFNPNGFGALAIVKNGNSALTGGELPAGSWVDLVYDTTNTNYQLLNPITAVPLTSQARAVRTTDQSVTSSTALVNDDTLSFAIAANEKWTFSFLMSVVEGASGGLDISVTSPAASAIFFGFGTSTSIVTSSGTRLAVFTTGGPGAPTTALVNVVGTVVNGANAGTINLQFSQDVSNGTATTFKTGSAMLAWKLN